MRSVRAAAAGVEGGVLASLARSERRGIVRAVSTGRAGGCVAGGRRDILTDVSNRVPSVCGLLGALERRGRVVAATAAGMR